MLLENLKIECTVSPIENGSMKRHLHLEWEGEGGGCGRRGEQEREYGGETHGERGSLMRSVFAGERATVVTKAGLPSTASAITIYQCVPESTHQPVPVL